MTARSLTFASLLFAAVQPSLARAGEPTSLEVGPSQSAAPEAPLALAGKWKLSVKAGVLVAELTLVNTGDSAVDIVVTRGHSPGPGVEASLGDVSLSQVLDQSQEREMWSRMGPMPTYGAIGVGRSLVAGTYKFTLPDDYAGKTLTLMAWVRGAHGGLVKLPVTMVLEGKGSV